MYRSARVFTLDEIRLPILEGDEILLEVILCGVDGSELKMFKGDNDQIERKKPLIFGDEIIGTIAAIGPAAAASRWPDVGDRVTVEDAARLEPGAEFGARHTVAIPDGESPLDTAERIRSMVGEVDIVIDIAGFASAKPRCTDLSERGGVGVIGAG